MIRGTPLHGDDKMVDKDVVVDVDEEEEEDGPPCRA